MSSLPNKSFVINYNARDYNPTTRTITRTSGQTLAQDMVFNKSTSTRYTNGPSAITQYDDHIMFSAGTYSQFSFSSGSDNPFNVGNDAKDLTIVIKYYRNKDFTDPIYSTNPGTDVIMNRGQQDTKINWYMRCSEDSNGKRLQFNGKNSNYIQWSNHPVIEAVRMSDYETTIMNLTDSITGQPFTFTLQSNASQSKRITFFGQNFNDSNVSDVVGCVGGDFYWVYISREVLTDEEIQQVVKFNEGGGISIDQTGTTIAQSGGTTTANIDADTGWTVTSTPSWVTVSPASGESGTTAITFTVKKNNFSSRAGVVVFTDDDGNEAEYTIDQGGTDGLLPFNKIYRNGRRIN